MEKPTPPEKFEGEILKDIPLSSLSTETLEVLQYFGPEAPHLLNRYCIALEDALLSTVDKNKKLQAELKALKENNGSTQQHSPH